MRIFPCLSQECFTIHKKPVSRFSKILGETGLQNQKVREKEKK